MRMLIEKNISAESRDAYALADVKEKKSIIKDALSSADAKLSGNSMSRFIDAIVKNKDYFEYLPLFDIAKNIKVSSLDSATLDTLLQLGQSREYGEIVADSEWIKDKSLFNDEDVNVAWKIKALTLADANKKDTSAFKTDKGTWKNITQFKKAADDVFQDLELKSDKPTKSKNSIVKQLAAKTGKSEEEVAKVYDETELALQSAIDNAVSVFTQIQGIPISKKDAREFIELNLREDPSMSVEDLLAKYLKAGR